MKLKACSLKRQTKINEPSARISKKKRKRAQFNKLEMKMEKLQHRNTKDHKRLLQTPYAYKMDYLE